MKRCAFFGLASSFLSDWFSVLHLNILTTTFFTIIQCRFILFRLIAFRLISRNHCRLIDIHFWLFLDLCRLKMFLYMLIYMVNCRKLFDTARTFMTVLLGGASDWNSNICPFYMYLGSDSSCHIKTIIKLWKVHSTFKFNPAENCIEKVMKLMYKKTENK